MREFTIHKNDADQRLDRFLGKAVPLLPASLAQKYIRLKRIKVNGARAERDYRLREGDRLQLYLNDEFFEAPSEENVYLTIANPKLHILYEDENILLLDKPAGLVVHADEGEKVNTLVNHMLAYLYQKREWKPREENAFTPALCNRIDRNTGGIVMRVAASAAVAGKKEGEGPLKDCFDYVSQDSYFAEDSWEKAETSMLRQCFGICRGKAGGAAFEPECVLGGDLLNQCVSSSFALKGQCPPLSRAIRSVLNDGGGTVSRGAADRRRRLQNRRRAHRLALLHGGAAVPLPARIRRAAHTDEPMDGHGRAV